MRWTFNKISPVYLFILQFTNNSKSLNKQRLKSGLIPSVKRWSYLGSKMKSDFPEMTQNKSTVYKIFFFKHDHIR